MSQGTQHDDGVTFANRRMVTLAIALVVGLAVALAGFISPPAEVGAAGADVSVRSTAAKKKKALAKCNRVKSKKKRATCKSQVRQRFRAPVLVDVRDDYFAPASVTVKSGRRLTWDWGSFNGNSHNVMLDPYASQPKSLTRSDYFRLDTGQNYAIDYRFTRDLKKTGTYNFYCSLHSTVMRMQVKVKR
jgi:plastocyanin